MLPVDCVCLWTADLWYVYGGVRRSRRDLQAVRMRTLGWEAKYPRREGQCIYIYIYIGEGHCWDWIYPMGGRQICIKQPFGVQPTSCQRSSLRHFLKVQDHNRKYIATLTANLPLLTSIHLNIYIHLMCVYLLTELLSHPFLLYIYIIHFLSFNLRNVNIWGH